MLQHLFQEEHGFAYCRGRRLAVVLLQMDLQHGSASSSVNSETGPYMYNIDNGGEENGQVNCLHLFILSERLQNKDRELYGLGFLAVPDDLRRDATQ